MRNAEHAVTAIDVLDDDPHAIDIDDIGQVNVLALHLQIDAVEVLFARDHAGLDAGAL